jgi:hypothetical protein
MWRSLWILQDGLPNLQGQYDIAVVEREKGAEIAKRVRPADAA